MEAAEFWSSLLTKPDAAVKSKSMASLNAAPPKAVVRHGAARAPAARAKQQPPAQLVRLLLLVQSSSRGSSRSPLLRSSGS